MRGLSNLVKHSAHCFASKHRLLQALVVGKGTCCAGPLPSCLVVQGHWRPAGREGPAQAARQAQSRKNFDKDSTRAGALTLALHKMTISALASLCMLGASPFVHSGSIMLSAANSSLCCAFFLTSQSYAAGTGGIGCLARLPAGGLP